MSDVFVIEDIRWEQSLEVSIRQPKVFVTMRLNPKEATEIVVIIH